MANNLGENIEGRFVLIQRDWFKESLHAKIDEHPEELVFLALGGFGCSPTTAGSAVMGEFVVDGERCRVEGYDLEGRFATREEVEAAMLAREEGRVEFDGRVAEAFRSLP